MIQPTDLRIGNLAYLKQETKSDTVVTICVTDLVMLQEGKKHLLPIPLSEEWLKRMGFIKESFSDQYRLGPRLLIKRKHGFYDYGSNVLLKHVHRLQNFWYELEGSELTINL